MKYSARLVTALAVIVLVVATIVAAFTKLTATATRTVVSTGVLMAGIALTAIVAQTRGGVLFFYTSVLAFAVFLGIAIKRMTKATTRYTFFGATGPGTRMTLTTIQHQGHVVQHRHRATETTHHYIDEQTGIRRRLQRLGMTIATVMAWRRDSRHLPRLA